MRLAQNTNRWSDHVLRFAVEEGGYVFCGDGDEAAAGGKGSPGDVRGDEAVGS